MFPPRNEVSDTSLEFEPNFVPYNPRIWREYQSIHEARKRSYSKSMDCMLLKLTLYLIYCFILG